MKRINIHVPELKRMLDASLNEIAPDYGFGGEKKLSHAVVTEGGKTVRLSGIPAMTEKGVVGRGDMAIQMTHALELVKLTLDRAGATVDDIVHMNFYFTDRKQYNEKANPARWKFFDKYSKTGIPPSSTGVGVKELVHPDWMIEIEAVAVIN
jgi:enamine deaminase RidA (YjgF/YER057c/UK114 family)